MNQQQFLLSAMAMCLAVFSNTSLAESINNKEGDDVRLVAAYFDSEVVTVGTSSENTIQFTDCREAERTQRFSHGVHAYDNVSMDCTAAATRVLGVPVVSRFWIYTNVQPDTQTPFGDQTVEAAKLVRIFTASRTDAVRNSSGIGFFFGFNTAFVERDQLSVFANATINGTGETAAIHQFAGLVTGTSFESVSFKPYMDFRTDNATWRVWENLMPRAGHPGVEWGGGNYVLKANRLDNILFSDVVNESHLIRIPTSMPAVSSFRTEYKTPEITTISVYPDKRSAEILLRPYSSSNSIYLSEAQAFVEAGSKLWVRFSEQISGNRDVKMFASLNSSEPKEVPNYMGGNCYGFKECFALPTAEGVSGVVEYWFTMTDSNGQETVFKNGNDNFSVPVRLKPNVEVEIKEHDVKVVKAGSADAGAFISIKYDPARAVNLMRKMGKVADELSLVAVVHMDGQSESLEFPLGNVRAWTDSEMRLHYICEMGLLSQHLDSTATQIDLEVKLVSRVRGVLDGEYRDTVGAIDLAQ